MINKNCSWLIVQRIPCIIYGDAMHHCRRSLQKPKRSQDPGNKTRYEYLVILICIQGLVPIQVVHIGFYNNYTQESQAGNQDNIRAFGKLVSNYSQIFFLLFFSLTTLGTFLTERCEGRLPHSSFWVLPAVFTSV